MWEQKVANKIAKDKRIVMNYVIELTDQLARLDGFHIKKNDLHKVSLRMDMLKKRARFMAEGGYQVTKGIVKDDQ